MILPELATHITRTHPRAFAVEVTADLGASEVGQAATVARIPSGAWRVRSVRGEWLRDAPSFAAAVRWLRSEVADEAEVQLASERYQRQLEHERDFAAYV